jgi:hypothetical protein
MCSEVRVYEMVASKQLVVVSVDARFIALGELGPHKYFIHP